MNCWQLSRTMCSIAAAIGVAAITTPAPGALLANWTFEESRPMSAGPHAPEVGTGLLFAFHQGASEYSSPTGNGSEHSFNSTAWAVNDYYQIHYPQRVSNSAVRLRFDMASNVAEPPAFSLIRSTDGGPYRPSATEIKFSDAPPRVAWNSSTRQFIYSFSVTSDTRVLESISYRLICYDTLFPGSPNVNVRLDNVSIEAVPEPATGLLAACAVVGLTAFRRCAEAV